MKKWMIFSVLLLLLLAACQTVPDNETKPAGNTPSSGSVTPSTGAIPNTNTPATSVPATDGDSTELEGDLFLFRGHQPFVQFKLDLSKLVEGHLYYIDLKTQEITSICDETIMAITYDYSGTDLVYYVKASEPKKIYQTNQKDPSSHTVIYESTYGFVNSLDCADNITKQKILQFVADNKKFVVLNLQTSETSLVMEQYYLMSASFEYGIYETWDEHNYVFFRGKLSEGEKIKNYLYSRDTGKVEVEEDE